MLIDFTKTTFNPNTSPAISDTEMNKIGAGIELMKSAFSAIHVDSATYNATGSTSANYNLTSYRTTSPSTEELPLLFLLQPSITNAANATITPSWSETAYQIWDISTNTRVLASAIVANIPVQVLFDGSKFWLLSVVNKANLTHASQHAAGGDDVLTPENIGAAKKSSADIGVTITASGWTNSQNIISISGLTANGHFSAKPSMSITADQLSALQSANCVQVSQATGSFTLKAYGAVPTIDIPIIVVLRGDYY